ncbi:hypothetical protein ACFL2G_04135 [Candidatus Omnitrophota bacterium]
MARRAWLLSLFLAIIISLGVFSLNSFGKEKKSDDAKDVSELSEKIDEVLKNQQDIIARLEDVRAQQDIIRIRASR